MNEKKNVKNYIILVSSMSQPYTQARQKYFQNFHMLLCEKWDRSSRGIFSTYVNSTTNVI